MLIIATFFISCSDDDNSNQPQSQDETIDLILTEVISTQTHQLAVYTKNGKLYDGYNKLYFQLKNQNGDFIKNATFNWDPYMQMTGMQHGAPHSEITKTAGKETLYEGWIIFQMPGNDNDSWFLSMDINIGGQDYPLNGMIDVVSSPKRIVNVFVGSDGEKYILSMIEPTEPKVAINDMSAAIFKTDGMHNFEIVNNYKLKIDPRMPGMGNHGSPNNQDLTQGSDGFYHGKLSLTMTGLWKINLILQNENNEILKGEEIDENNESSSIFFEIEF